jgi:ATP-binding cassette subfamily F protein uup
VAKLDHVSHAFQDNLVIEDFSTTIIRGDRIGFVGANGVGKSTLLKILLNKLVPDTGKVKLGTKMEVAYFDQLREHLDMEKNLIDNVSDGQDFIEINGKQKHVISYLSEFLFTPDRVRTPAKALSGGEQNRAILAKVFSKPANVLVLDEPTNDLDIETLELLEDILLKFAGTVLLVSHDRRFMDNVVTSLMVFEGDGKINEYVGGYSDWVRKGGKLLAIGKSEGNNAVAGEKKSSLLQQEAVKKSKKLSYKEQKELDQQPKLIEQLEAEQSRLEELIALPNFYQDPKINVEDILQQVARNQNELKNSYQRWEQLEELKKG